MDSVTEPHIPPASLGGGVGQDMIDRLLGHREGGAAPALMQNTETNELTFMGLPYRGDANLFLKKDDPQWRQPQMKYEMHVQIFNLADKADLEAYTDICQQVADSKALISFEKLEYDKVQCTWRVLLRWMGAYMQGPTQEPARPSVPKEK